MVTCSFKDELYFKVTLKFCDFDFVDLDLDLDLDLGLGDFDFDFDFWDLDFDGIIYIINIIYS